jgi:alpha,alpha-trehalase
VLSVARREGDQSYVHYLPQLKAEYDYWMDGSAALRPREGHRRVVRLADGSLLNRYWDDRPEPRDESYREDVKTASERPDDPGDVYQSLRAGAESGWDYGWLSSCAIAAVAASKLINRLERSRRNNVIALASRT